MTEVRIKLDRLAPDSVPLTTELRCQGESEEGSSSYPGDLLEEVGADPDGCWQGHPRQRGPNDKGPSVWWHLGAIGSAGDKGTNLTEKLQMENTRTSPHYMPTVYQAQGKHLPGVF